MVNTKQCAQSSTNVDIAIHTINLAYVSNTGFAFMNNAGWAALFKFYCLRGRLRNFMNSIEEDFKTAVIQHMNEDHRDAVELYVRAFAPDFYSAVQETSVAFEVTDMDLAGIIIEAVPESKNSSTNNPSVDPVQLSFEDTIGVVQMVGMQESRRTLVEMVKVARNVLGISQAGATDNEKK